MEIDIEYVCGFLFSDDGSEVALILKNRGPKTLIGKLNGIGGKVERMEFSSGAMSREFMEEAGVMFEWSDQFFCLTIDKTEHSCDKIYFYRHFSTELLSQVKTMESEKVIKIPTSYIEDRGVVNNLKWIIPLALDREIDQTFSYENLEVGGVG